MPINISYLTRKRTGELLSAFNTVREPIQQMIDLQPSRRITRALREIKSHTGIVEINSNKIAFQEGDRRYTLVSENQQNLRLTIRNTKSNYNIVKDVRVENHIFTNLFGFRNDDNLANKALTDICDAFDFAVLKLRRVFVNDKYKDFMHSLLGKVGMSKENQMLSDDIVKLFKGIHEKCSVVKNSSLRSKIKNEYNGIKPNTINGSRQFVFENVNGKDYLVNVVSDKSNKKNLVISITDKDNTTSNIIIEKGGRILKSKHITSNYQFGEGSVCYTQKELDSPDFKKELEIVKAELEKYDTYINERLQKWAKFKAMHSTTLAGVLDKKMQKSLSNLKEKHLKMHRKYRYFTKDIRKAGDEKLQISLSKCTSKKIIYKNIGPYQETVHVSFPKEKGHDGVKILVLGYGDKIKKSYFIQESKLIKYEATKINKNKDRRMKINFYSQEEIDNSGLNEYLNLLNQRLDYLLTTTSKRSWYRKK